MEEERILYFFTEKEILKGLANYTYQFDGYSEYAEDWAKDGLTLFIKGAYGEFDEEEDGEDSGGGS